MVRVTLMTSAWHLGAHFQVGMPKRRSAHLDPGGSCFHRIEVRGSPRPPGDALNEAVRAFVLVTAHAHERESGLGRGTLSETVRLVN